MKVRHHSMARQLTVLELSLCMYERAYACRTGVKRQFSDVTPDALFSSSSLEHKASEAFIVGDEVEHVSHQ